MKPDEKKTEAVRKRKRLLKKAKSLCGNTGLNKSRVFDIFLDVLRPLAPLVTILSPLKGNP